ncbi:MAG: hydrogenase maturation nickel metallochaperone HypA [Deltaproteobacteria bacterium]|nr:hydrogenase maturation nickel metallochaperone HypA [Deltaproteobacteria bacterium]
MHELPVTESILCIVLDEAKMARAARVTRIELTIGRLSGIVPECVQFQFDVISQKTIAAGATLVFNRPQAEIRCRHCRKSFLSEGFDQLICPTCEGMHVEVLSGRELTVDAIEWE